MKRKPSYEATSSLLTKVASGVEVWPGPLEHLRQRIENLEAAVKRLENKKGKAA